MASRGKLSLQPWVIPGAVDCDQFPAFRHEALMSYSVITPSFAVESCFVLIQHILLVSAVPSLSPPNGSTEGTVSPGEGMSQQVPQPLQRAAVVAVMQLSQWCTEGFHQQHHHCVQGMLNIHPFLQQGIFDPPCEAGGRSCLILEGDSITASQVWKCQPWAATSSSSTELSLAAAEGIRGKEEQPLQVPAQALPGIMSAFAFNTFLTSV